MLKMTASESITSEGGQHEKRALKTIRELAAPAVEELFKTTWPVTTWVEVLAQ